MPPAAMNPADFVRWFRVERLAFQRVLDDGDLAASVPGCPGWSLADLAVHLGGVHRWARRKIVHLPDSDEEPPPRDREPLVRWFEEGATVLEEVLAGVEPNAPCWTMAPPATASFWMRRQAHETAMHRWDAQRSQADPQPIDALLAEDGVAEVVEMFFPRQVRLGRQQPLVHRVRIQPTGGAAYLLAGDGTRPDADAAPVDATITGSPQALLLLLWKRTRPQDPRIDLTGSTAALTELMTAHLTP